MQVYLIDTTKDNLNQGENSFAHKFFVLHADLLELDLAIPTFATAADKFFNRADSIDFDEYI